MIIKVTEFIMIDVVVSKPAPFLTHPLYFVSLVWHRLMSVDCKIRKQTKRCQVNN